MVGGRWALARAHPSPLPLRIVLRTPPATHHLPSTAQHLLGWRWARGTQRMMRSGSNKGWAHTRARLPSLPPPAAQGWVTQLLLTGPGDAGIVATTSCPAPCIAQALLPHEAGQPVREIHCLIWLLRWGWLWTVGS